MTMSKVVARSREKARNASQGECSLLSKRAQLHVISLLLCQIGAALARKFMNAELLERSGAARVPARGC